MATITPRTGPLLIFTTMIAAYITANTIVQIKKNVPITWPAEAPAYPAPRPLLASTPTIPLPQYASPTSTVTTAPQRNHHSARDIMLGIILALLAESISFMNGTLTRLKK